MRSILTIAFAFAYVMSLQAKDVKITEADADKIVTCHVGDVLIVANRPRGNCTVESGSGLCVRTRPVYWFGKNVERARYFWSKGCNKVDVEKAGKDWGLTVCSGESCYKVHIDAEPESQPAPAPKAKK